MVYCFELFLIAVMSMMYDIYIVHTCNACHHDCKMWCNVTLLVVMFQRSNGYILKQPCYNRDGGLFSGLIFSLCVKGGRSGHCGYM